MAYLEDLKTSLSVRTTNKPQVGALLAVITTLIVVYLLASLVLVPPSEEPEFNFRDERGSVTALSAICLAMGSAFALVSLYSSSGLKPRLLWLGVSGGLAFLAMDELLEFHERIGRHLDRLNISGVSETFRGWNDIIVIIYGFVALIALLFLFPTALKYPRYLEILGAAFLLYAIHTVIDSTQEPPTTTSVVLEESAKALCAAMLAFAQFVGLLDVMRTSESESRA